LDRITFIDYTRLPVVIAERLFAIFDKSKTGLLAEPLFSQCMFRIFASEFQVRARLIFQLYDFDNDGKVTKEDVRFLLTYLPLGFTSKFAANKANNLNGKFHVGQSQINASLPGSSSIQSRSISQSNGRATADMYGVANAT
jgi:hypothetical protein